MDKLVVLVLSAGTQVGQNVRTTLTERRNGVTLIATSSVDNEPALFDFDAVYMAPLTAAEPQAFEAALLAIMERERVDLVIPCRDDDVVFLGSLRDRRADLAPRLLCGSGGVARVLCDKWLSHEFCSQRSLPFAATMTGRDDAQRAAFVRQYGFPLLAKPRRGWSSMEVYVVHKEEQLVTMLSREEFIVQEYLGDRARVANYLSRLETDGMPLFHDFQGVKHTIQALINPDGAVEHVFCMRLTREMRRSKYVVRDDDPRALGIGVRCAQAFAAAGWRGPLNIQCGESLHGDIRIHEFSGRFTGATVDRWLLGYDEVGAAIERFCGRRIASAHRPAHAALEAFESRVGRAADPRDVETLRRERVWRRA